MPGKLTVACKIPNGLILRNFEMVEHDVPIMGGGKKTEKRAVQIGEPIKIHGPATPFGQAPKALIVGGFAMTPGVDADAFNAWLKANADHDAVKNGLIFGYEKADNAEGKAKEMRKVQSGLQPLVPDKDERIPRGNANVSQPTTAEAA